MAQDIVGADLAQLEELSTAFHTAGTEISAKAVTLDTKINAAITAFETSLNSMQTEASTLTTSIDDEMVSLGTQADGVQWTGANRGAFDGDLARLKTVVDNGTAQIGTDITSIKTQVDSNFNPVLVEFGIALKKSGEDVDAATTDMQTSVANQRTNLDQAANVGWTSA